MDFEDDEDNRPEQTINEVKEDIISYTGEIINLEYCDRILAIMIADEKMYISEDNHQSCFQEYCDEYQIDSGIVWEEGLCVDEDEAVQITHSLFQDETKEIYGFDVFDGPDNQLYLTSHFPSNMEKCFHMIKKYADENNCILGTFYNNDLRDWNVKLIDTDNEKSSRKIEEDQLEI